MMYDRRKDMTKKKWKEKQKANRVVNCFNTGTRDMKTNKKPSRAKEKEELRKKIEENSGSLF